MRSLLVLLALALCTTAQARHPSKKPAAHPAPEAAAPAFDFPYPLQVDRLPNGLTVVRVHYPSPGTVAFESLVRVGSRNEVEAGRTGYAHFFEHMMFRGTKKVSSEARSRFLASVGADDNAFTTDDFTLFYTLLPTTGLDELLSIESDRFEHLAYSEPDFQTEAKAVLGEYHKDAAGPELKVEETLAANAFTVHPYRHTTLGFLRDVENMPKGYAYSQTFFNRWYTPDNVTLFIVGDFDDAKVMAAVKERYGAWQGKAANVRIPAEPRQGGQISVSIPWPSETLPRLINAWHSPAATLTTDVTAVQEVLAQYIAGPTSPLYKSLVLDKQWATSLDGSADPHRDPYLFIVDATLKDPQNLHSAQEQFNSTIKHMVGKPPDAARVESIKSHLKYTLLMNLNAPNRVATQLAVAAGAFGAPDALPKLYARIGQVKPSELQDLAKHLFLASNRTIVTLHPKSAAGNASKGGH